MVATENEKDKENRLFLFQLFDTLKDVYPSFLEKIIPIPGDVKELRLGKYTFNLIYGKIIDENIRFRYK